MWLRKTRLLPGGAPGGLVWKSDQDVVEVDGDLGLELVAIPDAGFVEVEPPAKAGSRQDKVADDSSPMGPKKRAARKPAVSSEVVE